MSGRSPVSKFDDALRLGKRGELFVFAQLLQHGIIPYVPLLDIEGVDCLARKGDGGYLKIQVKTNNTPASPLWWNTPKVPADADYILIFVSVPRDWACWIFAAPDFLKYCTGHQSKSGVLSLDLAAKNREGEVDRFKNDWNLIAQKATREPVEIIPKEIVHLE